MLSAIVLLAVGLVTTAFSYLCLLEAQSPLQIIALRLKSIRMRLIIKGILRNKKDRPGRRTKSE